MAARGASRRTARIAAFRTHLGELGADFVPSFSFLFFSNDANTFLTPPRYHTATITTSLHFTLRGQALQDLKSTPQTHNSRASRGRSGKKQFFIGVLTKCARRHRRLGAAT